MRSSEEDEMTPHLTPNYVPTFRILATLDKVSEGLWKSLEFFEKKFSVRRFLHIDTAKQRPVHNPHTVFLPQRYS